MTPARRSGTALAAGSALNGLLAYVVIASTTHGLGAEAAAPVAVLWSVWALCTAASTFPLQHWITSLAGRRASPVTVADLRPVGGPAAGIVLVVAVTTTALREPLFGRGDLWFPAMAASLALGAVLIGVVRGTLAAAGRFGWLAASVASENAVRCAAVLVLLALGSSDPVAYGMCLVAGYLVVAASPPVPWRGPATDAGAERGQWSFVSGAGSAQLLHQVVLTGGPVAAAALGAAPAAVTGLFAASALFRAPFLVALGVAPRLTRTASLLVGARDFTAVRLLVHRTATLSLAMGALAAPVAFWLGPALLEVLFGPLAITRVQAALIASGCVLAVANLATGVITLALRRPGLGARAWLVASAVAAALILLTSRGPLALGAADRVSAAFLAAEAAAWLVLVSTALGAVRARDAEVPERSG